MPLTELRLVILGLGFSTPGNLDMLAELSVSSLGLGSGEIVSFRASIFTSEIIALGVLMNALCKLLGLCCSRTKEAEVDKELRRCILG
jgi:hypothetical protein